MLQGLLYHMLKSQRLYHYLCQHNNDLCLLIFDMLFICQKLAIYQTFAYINSFKLKHH